VTPGIMIGATILFGRAMAPVEALIGNWSGLATAWNAYARLNQLMSGIQQNGMLTELPDPSGAIRLEGVSLAGLPGQPPILRQIGFDIAAGRSIGILGPSGAGKSSLAKIITGIWAPSDGVVRIDGADLAHWNKAHLGAHVGYLPQDVELFQGTIAENIARFEEDAGDAVLEAARQAGSYEMILRLPHGFDTRLGEGGIQLSAGQAQRIGLARALFRGPRIVVLDEPNANLDADGEQALIRTLVDLKQSGATVVMITHKPSLVATLDALLVLREGRVELIGPRDEVLARLYGSLTPNAPASPGKGVT
jgi:ABC-type protease/lipase transport system fused ATPase/permease subunit